MGFLTVIVLSLGLCFDSFAVSFSGGVSGAGRKWPLFLRFAAIMALFQGAMPLAGWFLTERVHTYIERIDHWVAFILLGAIGIKMIKESLTKNSGVAPKRASFGFGNMCLMGFATSIDAMVAGMVMAMVKVNLIPGVSQMANVGVAVAIIAVITFAASLTGLALGNRSTGKLGEKAELIGGIILVAIGVKILIEHIIG